MKIIKTMELSYHGKVNLLDSMDSFRKEGLSIIRNFGHITKDGQTYIVYQVKDKTKWAVKM